MAIFDNNWRRRQRFWCKGAGTQIR